MDEEKIIQKDLDLIADILWWLRGYIADGDYYKPFSELHIVALNKVKTTLQKELNINKE
jgi:hypothetical protein